MLINIIFNKRSLKRLLFIQRILKTPPKSFWLQYILIPLTNNCPLATLFWPLAQNNLSIKWNFTGARLTRKNVFQAFLIIYKPALHKVSNLIKKFVSPFLLKLSIFDQAFRSSFFPPHIALILLKTLTPLFRAETFQGIATQLHRGGQHNQYEWSYI